MVSKLSNIVLYASNSTTSESMPGGQACVVRISIELRLNTLKRSFGNRPVCTITICMLRAKGGTLDAVMKISQWNLQSV